MPPKANPAPGPEADPEAPPDAEGQRIQSLDERFGKIETEQERQGGLLTQILGKLGGSGPSQGQASKEAAAADSSSGKTVAELVREGVEQLEAEKQAKADADAAAAERADHASRIKALEEARPREVAATPVGKFRAAVQKYGFGIEQDQ